MRDAWDESHVLEDLQAKARNARESAHNRLRELSVPHLPTIPELREKAEEMFHETPSLDMIVNRAHELLAEAVAQHLYDSALGKA